MDRLSVERRSWNMSRIRGTDTQPEVRVRKVLHRMGYRFRLHRKELPGRPDIVLPRHRTVLFVHGCYWHRHQDCRLAYTPKSHTSFWLTKLNENVRRDRRVADALRQNGWHVGVVWECQTKDLRRLTERLVEEMDLARSCRGNL